MKKTIVELIDELCITHCKIYGLVNKVMSGRHTKGDAKKIQELNSYRSKLKNAISEHFGERQEVKTHD